MDNKYVLMVMGAIMGTLWWYVGEMDYFAAAEGGLHEDWWYGAIIAIGLGAGSTGGTDAVSILVEGITGYISTIILLVVFTVVSMVLWTLVLQKGTFDPMAIVHITAIMVASAVFTNLTLSYLRKAA
jgi:uncharacterized membrane-anchored protein YitT (DUF2179 family)